jgi:hypothetical protein
VPPQDYSRFGQTPDPRQLFLDWIRAGLEPSFFGPVSEGSYGADVAALYNDVHECHETMPSWACHALGIPRGSSYAQAIGGLHGALPE